MRISDEKKLSTRMICLNAAKKGLVLQSDWTRLQAQFWTSPSQLELPFQRLPTTRQKEGCPDRKQTATKPIEKGELNNMQIDPRFGRAGSESFWARIIWK